MTDYLKEAISLVKAQAAVRVMTEEEMASMIANLSAKLKSMAEGCIAEVEAPATDTVAPVMDAKKSIKERSITCLECGKVMKVLTKKHLALHGLDAVAYREKYGLKKGTPLAAKELVRARREKMKSMKLWEKRAAQRELQAKIGLGSVEDL